MKRTTNSHGLVAIENVNIIDERRPNKLETDFSIAKSRPTGDHWQSKHW